MAESKSVVARAMDAVRYAFTGTPPADWYGPGIPLSDQAPPEVKGRAFDYTLWVNVNYRPRNTERVDFPTLKRLANGCDPLRMVMGRQRDLLKSLEWAVKPKIEQKPGAEADPAIATITEFLECPDQVNDWPQWIGAVTDQLFTYDAVSISPRLTRGGGLYALEQIDGATITPLVNAWGRRPIAPDPAFKQILKSQPAVSYTTDELIYYPEFYRVDHIYGCSRVEQIFMTVETMMAQMKTQLGYFTHGNIGDGYFTAPQGYQPEQVKAIEDSWNAMMGADGGARLADKQQIPFLPFGSEFKPTKTDIFKAEFMEWLIRGICFQFGVSPTPFLKQAGLGHGSAQTDQHAADEAGLGMLMDYVRRLMNRILRTQFKRPDLEFSWVEDREMDPKTASEIQDRKLKNGTLLRNEARDQDGKPPLPDGDVPLIYTASGAVTVDSIINPPPPPPAPPSMSGHNGGPPLDDGAADDGKKPADEQDGKNLAKAAPAGQVRMADAIAAYFATKAEDIAVSVAASLGLKKAAPPSEDYGGRIDAALDDVDWNWSPLSADLEPILLGIAVASGTAAANDYGLFDKAALAKLMAGTTAFAQDRAAEMVGMRQVDGELIPNPDAQWSIPDATRNMLRTTIESALSDGLSSGELAKQIRESTAFSKERAMTIARTETADAQVQGTIAGWRATGVVAGKQWFAGEGCCDECQQYDGMIVGIDEDFPEGDPTLHPNCECGVLAVLPEDMPDADAGDTEE